MKRTLLIAVSACVAIAGLAASASLAFAQQAAEGGRGRGNRPRVALDGPVPRYPDGTVDLGGAWTGGGGPVLVREPNVAFVDDGAGKPVGIYRAIGRRPIAAFGNSDGDLQMLQYAAVGEGSRLAVLIHHDDMEREYAYDRDSRIGRLDKALDEAKARKWVVVSMKDDWKRIYPWEPGQ